jgi:Protein of unknown function (DUF3828)
MKNISVLVTFLFLSASAFLTNCSPKTQETEAKIDSTGIDSTQILQTIKAMYTWVETDTTQLSDFTLAYPKGGFCTGIDRTANDNRMTELKETGFFADEFFDNYNRILKKIDTEIKADTAKYKEGDGLETNYIDASPWCSCQDYPDKYWENMKIKDLVINGDEATAKWFWIWGDEKEEFHYAIKLKKVNNTWKISNLEGFENM